MLAVMRTIPAFNKCVPVFAIAALCATGCAKKPTDCQEPLRKRSISAVEILHKDVGRIRHDLEKSVLKPLYLALERGPGQASFKVDDRELTRALGAHELSIEPETAFTSNMFGLEPALIHDVLLFYAEAASLQRLVDAHVKQARNDETSMDAGAKRAAEFRPDPEDNKYIEHLPTYYGIYVTSLKPSDPEQRFGAHLVELGPPICQDRKPSMTGQCDGPVLGFAYRDSTPSGEWLLKELGGPLPEGGVEADKLLPLVETSILRALVDGAEYTAAAVDYMRRVKALYERAQALAQMAASLEKALQNATTTLQSAS